VLILEYKLRVNQAQQRAIDEAIRTTQFIRNQAVRLWMDGRGVGDKDLQVYCAQLAKDSPFAARLNSQARQTAADRAWLSVARFYKHCREKKPGKKGYPRFVRHEAAFTTVVPGVPGHNPLFCQWFPTGTCVGGNAGVRGFRDKSILALAAREV
jgi:transposase